jgi:hypothetical protein
VQRIVNAAYLAGFPFSGLLRVAPYCVPGDIRVVSEIRAYSAKVPSQTDLRLLFYNPIQQSFWKVYSPKFAEIRSNGYEHPLLKSAALASYIEARRSRIDEDGFISMNAEN